VHFLKIEKNPEEETKEEEEGVLLVFPSGFFSIFRKCTHTLFNLF